MSQKCRGQREAALGKHTTNLTPVLLTRRLYFLPRAIHDPGHVSLRRGLRAALVVSLLLAFATRLGLDQSFATFLVFGGMALLVLADFGGPSRSRVLAYLTTVLVGIPLVAVGTLASGNVWTAIVATAAVTFAVTEVAVLGGYFATAQTGLLLAFVLAVSSVGSVDSLASRVAGWSVAGAVSILAGWLLWPRSSHAELRANAASVLRAISGILSAPSIGDSIGTPTEFEAGGRDASSGCGVALSSPSGGPPAQPSVTAAWFSDISVGLEPPVPWSGLVAFIRRSYTLWPSRVMTAAMKRARA
jgi:uncharacterized membrane protein YccC